MVDKQMRKVAAKEKQTRNKHVFKLRFETFPTIVSDIVNVPVPQESMLCEPRQKTTNDVPSAEEDMMRLNYLFDHLRLTQDRIQLWLDMGGETYPRQKK
ncbi:GTPase activating protein [Trichuris trichiura]|uniref:GTPase activating protein n=1 Tax=Trichuris trichiura TaxID=36087 RepID=A0A077ZC28_TRITR|nr:GTPase activating protein [Trichuris trichiura]